jgi:hypothetical protein
MVSMKYEVTLTRPAYEYATVELEAATPEAAEADALQQADDLDWQSGDRLPDDAPRVIETRLSLDQDD